MTENRCAACGQEDKPSKLGIYPDGKSYHLNQDCRYSYGGVSSVARQAEVLRHMVTRLVDLLGSRLTSDDQEGWELISEAQTWL